MDHLYALKTKKERKSCISLPYSAALFCDFSKIQLRWCGSSPSMGMPSEKGFSLGHSSSLTHSTQCSGSLGVWAMVHRGKLICGVIVLITQGFPCLYFLLPKPCNSLRWKYHDTCMEVHKLFWALRLFINRAIFFAFVIKNKQVNK